MNEDKSWKALFHIGFGLFVVYITTVYGVLYMREFFLLVLIGLVLLLSLAIIKYDLRWLTPWFGKTGKRKFPGKNALLFLAGCLLSLYMFPKMIALAAIMILTLGKPVADMFAPYGRMRSPLHKRRMMLGSVFGVLAGTAGATLFVPLWIEFFASLVSLIIETADIELLHISEHLTIPVIAGMMMYFMML